MKELKADIIIKKNGKPFILLTGKEQDGRMIVSDMVFQNISVKKINTPISQTTLSRLSGISPVNIEDLSDVARRAQ